MSNLQAIGTSVKIGAVAALNRGASLVEERARQLAPVRKIFDGGTRRIRFKTYSEVKADRAIRRRIGLGREYVAAPRTRLRSRRGMGKAKTSTLNTANANVPLDRIRSGETLANPVAVMRLSRHGRYEVKSGRSTHEGFVGGRLRAEITAVGATGEGSRYKARVISPTPYAKYQEFGTRHNAAHPYLRPALHETRGAVVSGIRQTVRDVIRGREVEVVVEV